ncbi:MAG: HPP family protein [Gemmataceae bacterium]
MNDVAESTQVVTKSKPGPGAVPEVVWAPLAGAALTLLPGLLGLAVGQPWLFPSLGPTAYLQAAYPQSVTARLRNVLAGHLLGALAGFAAVFLLGAASAPSPLAGGQLVPVRVWASALGMALALLAQAPLRLLHPPAAATTLLITLGGLPATWSAAGSLAAGVSIVAFAGEIVRRLRLAQPGQK